MSLQASPNGDLARGHGLGLATIFTPIVAATLLLVGSVVGQVGASALQALIVVGSLLLLVLSIPFAAFVAIRNRRRNPTQARLAIGGLATALLISSIVFIGMAKINAEMESLRKSIEERNKQGGNPNS